MKKFVHVAVGVIFNSEEADSKILLAKRSDDQHQGGLWEFPGGKVEQDESVQVALQRELIEELGMHSSIESMRPIIQIPFHYSDKSVLLDVWSVSAGELPIRELSEAEGLAQDAQSDSNSLLGREGQPLAWVSQKDLASYDFPAANKAIIDALLLPTKIAITQDEDAETILASVANIIKNHQTTWIQLRAPSLDKNQYIQLGMRLYGLCKEAGTKLIWNCPIDCYQIAFADGLHLSQSNVSGLVLNEKPIPESQWLSCACHNLQELEAVQDVADYVLISPVKETPTHPEANGLTWDGFRVLTGAARIPCYALGGLEENDVEIAQQQGGQGIAGISCFTSTQHL